MLLLLVFSYKLECYSGFVRQLASARQSGSKSGVVGPVTEIFDFIPEKFSI